MSGSPNSIQPGLIVQLPGIGLVQDSPEARYANLGIWTAMANGGNCVDAQALEIALGDPGTLRRVGQGAEGTEVVLEASADLLTWTAVSSNQVTSEGTVIFTQPVNLDHPTRWYRVRTGA